MKCANYGLRASRRILETGERISVLAAGRFASIIVTVAAVAFPLVVGGTGLATAATQMPAAAQASPGGTWHTAKQVPGTATLNKGGSAQVQSVSCASAGNCSAGGYYTDKSGHYQVFVVSEARGRWHAAVEVPGTSALNKGGRANIYAVSCASAGNCSAGGYYTDRSGHAQAFVVSQVRGTWRSAREAPGTAALNRRGNASISSVSCVSAGNCSAGGYYKDRSYHTQAFVISELNGTWRNAMEVPGTGALNVHGDAQVISVSCASAGNCAAGGQYVDSSHAGQAFVANEVHGTWHTAIEVPGTAALNTAGGAWISSVSCAPAGNCSAGGDYGDSPGHTQVFVVSEVNGTWETAAEVPGTAALNTGGGANFYSVSCASAGNCSAGGSYFAGYLHAFIINEVNGTWHNAAQLPGTAALDRGKVAYVTSVSCRSAGNCSAGGTYRDRSMHMQAFVASEVRGVWHTAVEVPGTASLNKGGAASVSSVSCSSAKSCSAGGTYSDRSKHMQAFVLSKS
jgi:hypothetical protein